MDGVASNLQQLSFGGRDAGDATPVSYYNANGVITNGVSLAVYRFSQLYDGFANIETCSAESAASSQYNSDAMACIASGNHFGRLYIWTAAEDMGSLSLSGNGYTNATPNSDISNVNAGSMIYDCTTGNHLKWYCGYGAHVQMNKSYSVSGLLSSTQENLKIIPFLKLSTKLRRFLV